MTAYSITSLASGRIDSGIVSPSAFGEIDDKLEFCRPLNRDVGDLSVARRILSTNSAARRR
jgi:hypothetical protein